MKWLVLVLVLVLAFASGCHASGSTFTCLFPDGDRVREACEARRTQADLDFDEKSRLHLEAEHRAGRERDEDMTARQEYRAALEPCRAGDARACFVTALYEDRHGAPSTKVEARYRFACVEGIGRACFMAGDHARTRVSTDGIAPRNAESIAARQLALASFTHGCELGDGESCRAGVELDPTRADLLDTACAAHYRWACTRLGR